MRISSEYRESCAAKRLSQVALCEPTAGRSASPVHSLGEPARRRMAIPRGVGANAQGIIGQLNIEWVHFIWNSWVLVALLVLVPRFRRNWWLIGVTVFAGWH